MTTELARSKLYLEQLVLWKFREASELDSLVYFASVIAYMLNSDNDPFVAFISMKECAVLSHNP